MLGIEEKKREEIKRRQYLRGRLVWSTKERMGKDRIQIIKNDRTVFFKMQVTDETTTKNRWKIFDLPFSCLILSETKKRKTIQNKPIFIGEAYGKVKERKNGKRWKVTENDRTFF